MRYVPNLLRGVTICLVVALVANVWLLGFAFRGWFTATVGIASGIVAFAIVVTYGIPGIFSRWRDDAYLASFVVWTASAIELALTDANVATAGRVRSTGFYVAFAVVSLSAYLNARVVREGAAQ